MNFKTLQSIADELKVTRQYLSQFCKKNNILKNENNLFDYDLINEKLKQRNPVKQFINNKKKNIVNADTIKEFEKENEEDFDDVYNIDDIKELIKKLNGKDFLEVKTEKEKLLTIKTQIEVNKLKNKLVEVETIRLQGFEIAKLCKDTLMTIPNRISNVIAGETNPVKIKKILDDEIIKSLKDLEKNIRELTNE